MKPGHIVLFVLINLIHFVFNFIRLYRRKLETDNANKNDGLGT